MDEDTSIIDGRTRNERIKDFILKNKKSLISLIIVFIILIISFYAYLIYLDKKREDISNRYNSAIIEYEAENKSKIIPVLKDIINTKDATYSPLALYFIIDNNLIDDKNEINIFFDITNHNLVGWQTLDIYQNLSITYLNSITINQKLKENLFKLPERN